MRINHNLNSGLLFFYLVFLLVSCTKRGTFSEPNLKRQKTVVVLGSSTAEGIGANPRDSSWVNKVNFKLRDDGKNANVINLAVAGYTTYKILPTDYLTADLDRNIDKALSYDPDLIIISLPSNDMANGYTDEDILNNYRIIINKIKEENRMFLILSTQPRNFSSFDKRKSLALFNEKLESIYPKKILHIYSFLASSNYLIKSEYSLGDGVHLNNAGHNVIFQALFNNNIFQNTFY